MDFPRGVAAEEKEGHGQKPERHERHAGHHREDDEHGRNGYANEFRDAEEFKTEADTDELGDDGQGVKDEQVNDAEGAPELAKPLKDQTCMSDTGDGTQALLSVSMTTRSSKLSFSTIAWA